MAFGLVASAEDKKADEKAEANDAAAAAEFPWWDAYKDTSQELAEERAKPYCAEKWASDYRMRKYCVKKQVEAYPTAIRLSMKVIEKDPVVLANALSDWHLPEHNTFDWRMLAYTLKKQLEAMD